MVDPASGSPAPLRVVHVTPHVSRLGGGVGWYVRELARHGVSAGIASTLVAGADTTLAEDTADLPGSVVVEGYGHWPPRGIAFNPGLTRRLRHLADEHHVVHLHGLRKWPSLAGHRAARRAGRPLVVSPHGGLYPQVLAKLSGLKRWIGTTVAAVDRHADCLHATSSQERDHLRRHGLTAPIAVVPIGIDAGQYRCTPRDDALTDRWPALAGVRRLLFLGIMDRKKGLLRLARSWSRLCRQFPDWRLVIAGPDHCGHEAEVRRVLDEAGGLDRTVFTGEVYGTVKTDLLAGADLFVMPSDWENFCIAVAEALASGVPVITARSSPWQVVTEHGCGWWIDLENGELEPTLEQALAMSPAQRSAMGERGRTLIETHFAWPKLVRQMRAVYEWVQHRADPPGCVDMA
jgi:glycosyltransferase involved in cell wall biosynthesis